jgi:peptide/nickel transport system substrate-binding protein
VGAFLTATLGLGLSACGASSHSTAAAKTSTTKAVKAAPLVIGTDYGSPDFTRQFNPFIPNARNGVDWMFEPLYIVNPLTGKQTPALATSYQWSQGNKVLTFTLRKGVKWSNGTPFTSADVVFTFNMLKQYPGMDTNDVWASLASVRANGPDQVVFTFKKVDVPDFFYIVQTMIMPKAQWSTVKDPEKYTNPNPVVDGPFELSVYHPTEYILKPNPYFWQHSQVKISEMVFPALTTNTLTDLMLSEGKLDGATIFTPNIEKTFVDVNPKTNHYWFAHGAPVSLYMNLTEYPFNQLPFREAMAYAINRHLIWKRGEYGYETPANQSMMPPGQQATWLDKSLLTKYPYHYDPAKAAQLLASMGLKKNSKGQLIGPNGKPLTVTIQVPTGWTDWVQDCKIIASELGKLGITVNIYTPSVSTNFDDLNIGHFQMALDGPGIYASPWFDYNQVMNWDESAPIGQIAPSNVERFHDPQVDKWLAEFSQTTNPTKQHALMDKLETVMFQQLPVVALVYGANWYEYSTAHYTGWPSASDPYSLGFGYPGNLLIATHLRPVS